MVGKDRANPSIEWNVESSPFIVQTDGHNCGPIVCLKLMHICGMLNQNPRNIPVTTYRPTIMDHYDTMLNQCQNDTSIGVFAPGDSGDLCTVCCKKLGNDRNFRILRCCGRTEIHADCLCVALAKNGSKCPFCKDDIVMMSDEHGSFCPRSYEP